MGRSRNDTTSDVQNGRHGQPCKSALHAGWVRSCLQDKSGRTNQACDWPTRTCNASGSRADCAAAGYRVKAGLPCERWLECNERVFRNILDTYNFWTDGKRNVQEEAEEHADSNGLTDKKY